MFTTKQITTLQEIEDLLFTRKEGLEFCLDEAENYHDIAFLQIYAALIIFFSFSQNEITQKFSKYLSRLKQQDLKTQELQHFKALQNLHKADLISAFQIYQNLIKSYPTDKTALIMLETTAFLSGQYHKLLTLYKEILPIYKNDPDFAGMRAFLLCHLGKTEEALALTNQTLKNYPHNAWIQHVHLHAILEQPNPSNVNMHSLEQWQKDWPTYSRFFEGHNSMHLIALWLKTKAIPSDLSSFFLAHIWGKSKKALFEQNNAFLSLYLLELNDYQVPQALWDDLAQYAKAYLTDYFTPYLTITSILSVAKSDICTAKQATQDYKVYCSQLSNIPEKFIAWHEIGLPTLEGCMAFIEGQYKNAAHLLQHHKNTKLLGHSDEQRSIFPLIYTKAVEMLSTRQNGG